jgi:methylmalonyl-CoA/ethylmalonyl-CoA epimerase
MVKRIHHINFVVRDLEAAVGRYEKILGMPVTGRNRLEERGVHLAHFLLGGVWLVLVQPVKADTAPARYLAEHGEGFFLLSLETDSLAGEIERLGEALFDGEERAGIEDWRVRDLDIGQSFGAQLQWVVEGVDKT